MLTGNYQNPPVGKLSDGNDATLGNYLRIVEALGMRKAADFLRNKIGQSPGRENEPVIAEESQMIRLLGGMEFGKMPR